MNKKESLKGIKAPKGVESFVKKLNALLKKKKLKATAMVGGSYAKGTFLKSTDVDVFVMFDKSYSDNNISDLLEVVLKPLKPEKIRGSRDYFQVKHFEVVPVIKIDNPKEAQNVMDVSPLHVDWVRKHIGKLQDDVKLAKLFCQAANIYGAESYVNGFSGYILEILIIYYRGFNNLLKAAAGWRPKVVIDPSRHHKGKNILKTLNASKLHSPLVVVDPVQPHRNAAAAVNIAAFDLFVLKAKQYLLKPSPLFFRHQMFSAKKAQLEAKKRGTKILFIEVKTLPGNKDVAGTKLLKAHQYIGKQLAMNEFRIMDSGWDFNIFWYELLEDILPKYRKHMGPLAYVKGVNMEKFLNKYKNIQVENNRLFVVIPRKYVKACDLLKDLVKRREVKERTKSVKVKC